MPGFRGAREIHYPPDHARARAAAFKALPDGSPCARCHHPMDKTVMETDKRGRKRSGLHYDHNRARSGYLGFSHGTPCPVCKRRCNLREGAAEGGRRASKTYGHPRRHQGGNRRPVKTGTPGPGW